MDDIVKAALKKWPNVPDCRGWLGLDARGTWYLRDAAAQRAGAFPQVKGSRIEHEKLREFIGRNYEADAQGCWFFQNGPQRVYVELELTPWIWRLEAAAGGMPVIRSHTGREAGYRSAWLDEAGRLLLDTDLGPGLVHSLDMEIASDAVEAGRWQPEDIGAGSLEGRFGYVRSPLAAAGLAPDRAPTAAPPAT